MTDVPAKDEARAREVLGAAFAEHGQQSCGAYIAAGNELTPDQPIWLAAMEAYASEREREAIERAARMLEAAIAEGYPTPANKVDVYKHSKFGWEDCIACYDEKLTGIATAIRRLSQKGGE